MGQFGNLLVNVRQTSKRSWLLRPLALLLLLAAGAHSAKAQSGTVTEYQLKAVYIVNVLKYADFPQQRDAITICVSGAEKARDEIEQTIGGTAVNNRPVTLLFVDSLPPVSACSLLFLAKDSPLALDLVLQSGPRQGLITVGESAGFCEKGGMINFYFLGRKLRMEINRIAASKQGIQFSSKLLKLARIYP